jgi:SAM-dependent methyltransferase
MAEPHASEFVRLLRAGAGACDIHGEARAAGGYAARTAASEAFIAREVARVDVHRRNLCALLDRFVDRAPRILDVGCSTGGTTVALALSARLGADVVVGVDPDELSVGAAEVRALGYRLDRARVSFLKTDPGGPLPFATEAFDLVVCVSVLEFVPTTDARTHLVHEMKRVLRDDGHLLLCTPSPFRMRDHHAKRFLGDVVRTPGYPWASPPWTLGSMLAGCERVPVESWLLARGMGVSQVAVPRPLACAVGWVQPWQKILVRKKPALSPLGVSRAA